MTAATTKDEQDEKQVPVRCTAPGCARTFARKAAFCPYCGHEQFGKRASAIGAAKDAVAAPELRPVRDDASSQASKDRGPSQPPPPPVDDKPKATIKSSPQESSRSMGGSSSNSSRKRLREHPLAIALLAAVILAAIFVVRLQVPDDGHREQVHKAKIVEPKAVRPQPPDDAAAAVKPSFTCPGDGFADEKTICANAGLASLEVRMQDAYQQIARRQPNGNIPIEVSAYKQAALSKRHACDTDVACIMNILLAEEQYFSGYGPPN